MPTGKSEDLRISARMFAFVILQPREGGFVDVGASHVLRDEETVGVFAGQALKLGHDLEQVRLGHILGIAFTLVLAVGQAGYPTTRAGRAGANRRSRWCWRRRSCPGRLRWRLRRLRGFFHARALGKIPLQRCRRVTRGNGSRRRSLWRFCGQLRDRAGSRPRAEKPAFHRTALKRQGKDGNGKETNASGLLLHCSYWDRESNRRLP